METLIEAQKLTCELLTNAIRNYRKDGKVRKKITYYKTKIEAANKMWAKFEEKHNTILQNVVAENPTAAQKEYFEKDLYNSFEESYCDYISELQESLDDLRDQSQIHQPMKTTSTIKHDDCAKLPKISLPTFSGDYTKWISFRNLYLSLIHNQPNLPKAQKLHYLRASLKDEAERLVAGFAITDENYDTAWEVLENRYNNNKFLVSSLFEMFINQPAPSESPDAIRGFLDTTIESIRSLCNLNVENLWDSLVVYLIVQKLPKLSRQLWEQQVANQKEFPTYAEIKSFLESRFRALEAIPAETKASLKRASNPQSGKFTQIRSQSFFTEHKTICSLCNSDHSLRQCPKFKTLEFNTKYELVRKIGLCINCLGKGHRAPQCPSKNSCYHCRKRHHTLLHIHNPTNDKGCETPSTSQQGRDSAEPNVSISSLHAMTQREVLLATALITLQGPDKITRTFRGLLDPGSQASFVSEHVVQTLGLRKYSIRASIDGLGQVPLGVSNAKVYADIVINSLKYPLKLEALVFRKLAHYLPSKTITKTGWNHIKGLNLADPGFDQLGRVDIVLGADIYGELILPDIRKGSKYQPVAYETLLGWVLSGPVEDDSHQLQTVNIFTSVVSLDPISQQLQDFWAIEETPSMRFPKREDDECEQFYEKTYRRLHNGRYCVRLPFISDNHQHSLGRSRTAAVASLGGLEKRFIFNPNLKEEYSKCIEEYMQLGHMCPAKTTEEESATIYQGTHCYKSYYLPHHAVFKESVSTRLRVVFDASRKTTSGVSLNDTLYTGPSLQNEMISVLMRWRRHKVALMADIVKMYRQIMIDEDDINYQRIVWRRKPDEPIKEYCLSTVTFGVTCAPYLAIRTLKQLARDEQSQFPVATQILLNDFYVDDVLTGAESIAEAIDLQRQLDQLLLRGGFKLKKWLSNESTLLSSIPADDRAVQSFVDLNFDKGVKSLGIIWFPTSDTFGYKINLSSEKKVNSKRELLSEISKLYDPLGWISPVIICAKILMQTLWIHGCEWDEQVPEQVLARWEQFKSQAHNLEQIRIPRWYSVTRSSKQFELHAFSDASQNAYATVVYLRTTTPEGSVTMSIIMAKTKIAPIKQVTIPRLELCGAVLAARVVKHVIPVLQIPEIEIHMWTDSSIVLSWLKGHPSKWATFVANRSSEIFALLGNVPWHHVPTTSNPADIASRGVLPSELINHALWWNGPHWLSKDRSHWPRSSDIQMTSLEAKRITCTLSLTNEQNVFLVELLNRFSSLTRLIRVTAYCLRVYPKRSNSNPTWLTSEELDRATRFWVQAYQRMHFSHELHYLQLKKPLPTKSKLLNLNPFIDADGVLRVGGRLKNTNLSFDKRHPIIIPKSGHLTTLLIRHHHHLVLHGGTQLTLSTLRQKYWIIDGRNSVRNVVHCCIRCHRFRAQTQTQLMGHLPAPRINMCRPFTHTGVDYCGPINVKTSKRRGAPIVKGYIALFVCLTVKAIHLEMVSDMTTQSFIAAFHRFVARRGLCKHLYSDCGTNFVGANSYLKTIIANQKEVAENISSKGVTWHFIPPHSPHFGGLWEAGIKSTKSHLRRILGNAVLTFEEMCTVLTQIEACLNSRPLCPITADPTDLTALTPGHFLIGDSLLAPPQEDISGVNQHRLDRWQLTQQMFQQFWKRWSSEYLARLQQRPKWTSQQINLQKGDLVLIKDDRLSPMLWPLGRVVDVYPGNDGFVRVADIRMEHTTVRRPITKLSRLPMETSMPAATPDEEVSSV